MEISIPEITFNATFNKCGDRIKRQKHARFVEALKVLQILIQEFWGNFDNLIKLPFKDRQVFS